jgi:hypothetical protein
MRMTNIGSQLMVLRTATERLVASGMLLFLTPELGVIVLYLYTSSQRVLPLNLSLPPA